MPRYSFGEAVRTAYALVLTKATFPTARLIRRPVYIRGGALLKAAPGLTTGYHCRFDLTRITPGAGPTLVIGTNCRMGDNVHIVASERVVIGDNCLMASKIFISDTTHGSYSGADQSHPQSDPTGRPLHCRPVQIGSNVWVGENVCILPGVSLGDGCIVNAGAVVTKSFEAAVMLAGVPARVIKRWDPDTQEWSAP